MASEAIVYNTPTFVSRLDDASNQLKEILRTENTGGSEVHSVVNAFIATYQALPVASRAKVENWLISLDDIKASSQDSDGTGIYSATYHGADVAVAKHNNIYSLDDRDSEAFQLQNEIRAMAQLRHPNIVAFLGANVCGETWTVVTERMPHGSVRSMYLGKQAQQPTWRPSRDKALAWALDLARAVTYLHHSNPSVTHRDLRPDTLFIALTGALKVTGFRRCSLLPRTPCVGVIDSSSGASGWAQTEPGAVAREAGYAAPELLRDGACADSAVDVFAAAAAISFLRTGRDPVPAQTSGRSAPRTGCVARHPGRHGGWGRNAGAALAAAAARDPARRPAADALLDALEAALRERRRGACRAS
jgi:serine/threonine protein kinase